MTQEQQVPEKDSDTNSTPSKLKRAWIWNFAILLVAVVLLFLLKSIYTNLSERGWRTYTSRNSGLASNIVGALAIDEGGRLWVGTHSGLSVLAPDGTWTTYTPEDSSLVGDDVNALVIDEGGSVWAGTSSGLSVLAPDGSWMTYTPRISGLVYDHVNALAIDEADRVWVGTRGGLSMLAPDGSWTTYTSADTGLVDDQVNNLAIDEGGRVWVGTSDGLSVLAPDAVTDPRPATALDTPATAAGVPENQCLALKTAAGVADLSSSLLSWWPGDGEFNELVSGTQSDFAGTVTFAPGKVADAFQFGGSAKPGAVLRPIAGITDQFTLDAWVNHFSTSPHNQRYIQLGGAGTDLAIRLEAGKIHFFAFTTEGPKHLRAELPGLNQWVHVAGVFNGPGGQMELYVNGVLADSLLFTPGTEIGRIDNQAATLLTGTAVSANGVESMNGLIDEASVFGRALSASEIQAIFQAGSAGKCQPGADGDAVTDPGPVTALGTPVNANDVAEKQCLALSTAAGGADLSSSLVSWWPGDGDATDIIGANDGRLTGGATFAPGFVGQAFRFSNGAVRLAVQPPLAQGFTIDAWVNFEGTNFNDFQEIFNNNQVFLRKDVVQEGNKLSVFVKLADGSVEPRAQARTITPVGTWTHVAATWNGTTLKLYVNGQLEGTSTRPGSLTTTTVQAQIGRGEQTNLLGPSFFGRIDEVDIFNRALSATEIRAIFQAGGAGKCQPDVPEADGEGTWTTYTSGDAGLVDGHVNALAIDKGGRVWMGTSNGLGVLAPDGRLTAYTSGLVGDAVTALAIDEGGRVWAGASGGLSVLAPGGTLTSHTSKDSGLAGGGVQALAIDDEGHIWVGSGAGLNRFDESASTGRSVLQPVAEVVNILRLARNLAAYSLAILSIGVVIQRRRKPTEPPSLEPAPSPAPPAPPPQPGTPSVPPTRIPSDPQVALAEARELLSQGKKEEAVAHLMHAFREGSPEIRREAINELEELGEVEAF